MFKKQNKKNLIFSSVFILVLLFGSLVIIKYSKADNQIIYYNFNENLGTTLNDTLGNNYGTINGATWVSGVEGSALNFDGVDDYVVVPTSSDFEFSGSAQFTISGWFNFNDIDNWQGLITKWDGNTINSQWGLFFDGGRDRLLFLASSDGKYHSEEGLLWESSAPNLGTWYYIVGVDDGTNMKLYVNAQEVASMSSINKKSNSDTEIIIGGSHSSGVISSFFNGIIDEVNIYDRALTAGEIDNFYLAHASCMDNDGDGYGNPGSTICSYSELDCDDTNADINPGVKDVCGNNIDENCSGSDLICPTNNAYYVSPSGNDDGPGTEEQPWQTISKVNATSFGFRG